MKVTIPESIADIKLIQYQKYAESLKRDIRSANKALGLSDSDIPVLKFLDDALGAWQSAVDMKI